jgi:hypothetical protein
MIRLARPLQLSKRDDSLFPPVFLRRVFFSLSFRSSLSCRQGLLVWQLCFFESMDPMLPPPGPKRQKVRKGTHSCWECKRRKMKCVFDPLSNIICNPCRRRGSRCVSQEMPEDVWVSKYRIGHEPNTHIGRGINYTDEARTPLTPSEDHRRMSSGIPTPASTISENSRYLAFHQSSKVCFQ